MVKDISPRFACSAFFGGKNSSRGFLFFSLVLVLAFCKPLFDLVLYSFHSSLHSHAPLVPFISFYLIWLQKESLPSSSRSSPVLAAVFWLAGLSALTAFWVLKYQVGPLARNDSLALTITSFLCFFVGGGFFCFGAKLMQAVAFPVLFLVFSVPFPTVLTQWIEAFLQHTSAEAAFVFLKITDVPVFREGLVFRLPGISLRVAEECSGIRSTLVLLMTSLIAGHLFLRSPWNRAWFVLATIPLGIIRNGFRVLVISLLCVYVDPGMINSVIHRRGGPLFFVLSLIPLFGLLILMRKRERKREQSVKMKKEIG